jgi:hypothetical protein
MEPIHDEEGVKNKEELSPKARKIWKWIGLGVGCLMMSVAGFCPNKYFTQLHSRHTIHVLCVRTTVKREGNSLQLHLICLR